MNFSILAPHRITDKWTIPLSFTKELMRQGHTTKIYSTFDCNDNYSQTGLHHLLYEAKVGIFKPDVILTFDFGLFTSPELTKESFPEAIWILEAGDDPQNFHLNSKKLITGRFDVLLTPDIRCVKLYQQNFNQKAIWCPHFADESLYNIHQDPIYDAVTTRSVEEPFFTELRNRLGDRFQPRKEFLEGEDHSRHLMKGKVIVQNSKYKEITRRIFEGMLAQRLVITDRIAHETNISQIFKENEDIVYFDDINDCVDKINFYTNSKNEHLRLKIATSGFNKVKEKHTVKSRVSKLLYYINENIIHK